MASPRKPPRVACRRWAPRDWCRLRTGPAPAEGRPLVADGEPPAPAQKPEAKPNPKAAAEAGSQGDGRAVGLKPCSMANLRRSTARRRAEGWRFVVRWARSAEDAAKAREMRRHKVEGLGPEDLHAGGRDQDGSRTRACGSAPFATRPSRCAPPKAAGSDRGAILIHAVAGRHAQIGLTALHWRCCRRVDHRSAPGAASCSRVLSLANWSLPGSVAQWFAPAMAPVADGRAGFGANLRCSGFRGVFVRAVGGLAGLVDPLIQAVRRWPGPPPGWARCSGLRGVVLLLAGGLVVSMTPLKVGCVVAGIAGWVRWPRCSGHEAGRPRGNSGQKLTLPKARRPARPKKGVETCAESLVVRDARSTS